MEQHPKGGGARRTLTALAMALAMSLPAITPGHAGDTPINLCDHSSPIDTVLHNNATGEGGIHAVLMDYDDPLTRTDFTSSTPAVIEIP